MQQRTNHELNMLKRVIRFVLENPITPAIIRVTELNTEISAAITAIESAASTQTGGSGDAAGGVVTKKFKYQALRSYLKDVARVGRSLDRDTYPGLAEGFVLPRTNSYPALVAAAQAMIEAATPHETAFVAHGLPGAFLADLAVLLMAFTAGTNAKIDGMLTQVEGTSALKYRAAKGVEAAQKLDAIIRAHFRDDPVTLDVWTHARHIQVAPVRESDEETVPETAAAGGAVSSSSGTTVPLGGTSV